MDGLSHHRPDDGADLTRVARFAGELANLKRVRDARSPESLASRLFQRAWANLCSGVSPHDVAWKISTDAIVATLLGGIDADILRRSGLGEDDIKSVNAHVLDHLSDAVSVGQRAKFDVHIRSDMEPATRQASALPAFVDALIRQPRAGATHPGRARLILEPPENHGDHCLAVAVLGVLLSEQYGADPGIVFLAGLAHHLHNATLPDAGFAGEVLLGEHLTAILRRLVDTALTMLQSDLAGSTRRALTVTADVSTPEGRAFNAADVIDRVTEVRHFAQIARFTEAHALNDMQVVHEGPLQAFHYDVIQRAGLNVA